MFAFVLYDGNNEEIYVARDPYGVRPLYVLNYNDNNTYGFASELKVLSCLMNNTSKPTTKNGSIKHVLPGTYLTFQKDKCNNDNLWKLNSSLNTSLKGINYTTRNFSKQLLISKKKYVETELLTQTYNKICNNLINAVKKESLAQLIDQLLVCFQVD